MKNFRGSCALNQWRTAGTDLALLDRMESAFNTIAVSGFEAIEITDNALGGHTIPAYFGSRANFLAYLKDCGLTCVTSHLPGLAHGNPAAAASAAESLARGDLQDDGPRRSSAGHLHAHYDQQSLQGLVGIRRKWRVPNSPQIPTSCL